MADLQKTGVPGGGRHAIAPDASCLNFNSTRRFGLKQQAGTIMRRNANIAHDAKRNVG